MEKEYAFVHQIHKIISVKSSFHKHQNYLTGELNFILLEYGEKIQKDYFTTSALPYANGPVYIGHLAGVYVPADIYARTSVSKVKMFCSLWSLTNMEFYYYQSKKRRTYTPRYCRPVSQNYQKVI